MKARLADLIGSSGIENATSAQPKNLASAPRLSPLRFFGGVAGDETTANPNLELTGKFALHSYGSIADKQNNVMFVHTVLFHCCLFRRCKSFTGSQA